MFLRRMLKELASARLDTSALLAAFNIGMWVAYMTVADLAEHLERMAVAEPIIPGVSLSPPLLGSRPLSEARPIIGGIPLRRLGHLSSRN